MPAVMIRLLDALAQIADSTPDRQHRQVLFDQAAMVERATLDTIREQSDREDVPLRNTDQAALLCLPKTRVAF